jgi:HSP20 family molecular chaperone IbpA
MFDLMLFDKMFPNYYEYKTPMWSTWKEDEKVLKLEVAVPGYSKEDFTLYIEGGTLFLKIKDEKKTLSYSIIDRFYLDLYKVEEAVAKYKNGILIITIPKEVKRVAIEVS